MFLTSYNAQGSCPQERIIQPKMSVVPKLRNSDVKEASSHNSKEDKVSGSYLPLLTTDFLILSKFKMWASSILLTKMQ